MIIFSNIETNMSTLVIHETNNKSNSSKIVDVFA